MHELYSAAKSYITKSYVYRTVHYCDSWRIKDQLDVTCYFIWLLMRSACFGHVQFYSKKKFEKLVRLFVFIIRIYRDARSLERQIQLYNWRTKTKLMSLAISFHFLCAQHVSKHVEFYSKNKFEKLVRLFGFIIRIYRDARSRERQIQLYTWRTKTNLMSLAISFQFLCAQHVSDINISIIRSLWLFCRISTLVDQCGNSKE